MYFETQDHARSRSQFQFQFQSQSRSPRRAAIASIVAVGLAIACGSGDRGSPEASAPVTSGAAGGDSRQVSALAQRCLDLVRSESYVEAIDPCQRALANGADANVEAALAEAQSSAQQRVQATAESLGGSLLDSTDAAAQNARDAANALQQQAQSAASLGGSLLDSTDAAAQEAQDAANALQQLGAGGDR
jgi:hypothetical protein